MMRNGNTRIWMRIASQAEKYLGTAQNLAGADNAEIHLLKKMAYSLKNDGESAATFYDRRGKSI
jgi:hypothetical protein